MSANVLTRLDNPDEKPPVYESIDLGTVENDYSAVMEAFVAFTKLPFEERVKVEYLDEARPRTGRGGYQHKGEFAPDGSPLQDNKHLFHYTHGMDDPFAFLGKSLAYDARRFLGLARDLYYATNDGVKGACVQWEEDLPGITGMLFPRSGKVAHHDRYLGYQRGPQQDERPQGAFARGHYDKAYWTCPEWTNQPGLQVGYGPDDLEPVDQSSFNPISFPSFGYHQLAEMLDQDVRRRAAWHLVDQPEVGIDPEVAETEDIIRMSKVKFINPANIYLHSTSEQTHTPIRWREPSPVARTIGNTSFLRSVELDAA